MPLPLTAQQLVGQELQMLPARALGIITPTGGEQMQMGMVLAITPMRVEHRDVASLERLPPDSAVEIVEALRPTAYKRAQYDRRILVESGAEHRRDCQDDVPIDDALMEDLTHLAYPVVYIDFGAPQAQGRFTAHGHQVFTLAAVQAAIFDIADLFRVATCQHLRHQPIVVGGLIPWMGTLKRLPV